MLKINNISKRYKNKKILNSINLEINDGEIIGLIGQNGSGKSTLMKVISLLTPFNAGNIYLNNIDIKKDKENLFNNLGVFIERPYLYEEISGYQNLKIISRLYKFEIDLDSVCQIFECTSFIHEKVKDYSLGMKQKIGIMIAFINNPSLVLLDEPFNSLDKTSENKLIDFINEYKNKGNSLIIASHSIEKIENICDRILTLKDGNLNEFTKENLGDKND